MIQDGSLLSQFEEVIFTGEFTDLVLDASHFHFEDDSCLPLVVEMLHEFEKRIALRLSVSLEELIDLLFSGNSTTVALTLSPETYRLINVPIKDAFDEIFPTLSELVMKPLNQHFMSTKLGK